MKLKALGYYFKRCGVRGLIDKDYRNQKIYSYFENLPVSEYSNELKAQLKSIITDTSNYNIDEPETFNEKIQWLKVHNSEEMLLKKAELADKYAVREWISNTIGEEYLIPLAGGPWKRGEDINFDELPDKFVLKANHGSGMNYIVKDKSKINKDEIIKLCNSWMDTLFGWRGMETHYFRIPRRIIAEEYIEQMDGNLLDYKIYCFNGKPLYFQMIGDRDLETHDGRVAFYDLDWNLCDFNTCNYLNYEHKLKKPDNIDKLIEIAEKLSAGFKYVRVDLYVIENEIKFGEMTFTPGNGFLPWKPAEANLEMGKKLDIN